MLPSRNDRIQNYPIQNYQVIRNLLAAIQHGRKHILMCDERRPDLALQISDTLLFVALNHSPVLGVPAGTRDWAIC
jgi:hypothetical protein